MADNRSNASSTGSVTPFVPPPRPLAPLRRVRWSEEATAILISAWGEKYLATNRGRMKNEQWTIVASNFTSSDPPRTEKQCRQRIDNVKKRFKAEKAKVDSTGQASDWRFYTQMASLMGVGNRRAVGVRGSASSGYQVMIPYARERQHVQVPTNHFPPSTDSEETETDTSDSEKTWSL